MRKGYAAASVLLAAMSLAACSQDSSAPASSPSTPHIKKATSTSKKGPSVDELTAGMASAPTLGKSALPLDLKFELADRPKIGQLLEINLALVPQVDGGPASVQMTDSPGLDAAQGDSPFEVAEVQSGEVYRHTLHVTPNSEGVLLVNVSVALKHDEISDTRAFSVPVIVDR